MNPAQMNACQMASALREGKFTSMDLVQACLDRIAQAEDRIGAWQYLDPDYALAQAQRADLARRENRDVGPLNGIPVGIKDIVDTADMPTSSTCGPYRFGRYGKFKKRFC